MDVDVMQTICSATPHFSSLCIAIGDTTYGFCRVACLSFQHVLSFPAPSFISQYMAPEVVSACGHGLARSVRTIYHSILYVTMLLLVSSSWHGSLCRLMSPLSL
jgi:hypothetical protein